MTKFRVAGEEYEVRVSARNKAGESESAKSSNSFVAGFDTVLRLRRWASNGNRLSSHSEVL